MKLKEGEVHIRFIDVYRIHENVRIPFGRVLINKDVKDKDKFLRQKKKQLEKIYEIKLELWESIVYRDEEREKMIKDVWEYYSEHKCTMSELGNKFKIEKSTAQKYIKYHLEGQK